VSVRAAQHKEAGVEREITSLSKRPPPVKTLLLKLAKEELNHKQTVESLTGSKIYAMKYYMG